MKNKLIAGLVAAGIVASASVGYAAAASAPRTATTPAGTTERSWLLSLEGTGKVVSGYFGNYAPWFNATSWTGPNGQVPGLVACDMADVQNANTPGGSTVNTSCAPALLKYAQAGGLASVSWHGPSPTGSALNGPIPAAQFAQVDQPNTAIGKNWDAQLNQIAAALKTFADAGVPVLFRPLLEMRDPGFWYGGQDPATFRAVWQYTSAYVKARLGANGADVLFVWSPGGNDQPGTYLQQTLEQYYPGNSYVSVIGEDNYSSSPLTDPTVAGTDSAYQYLSAFAKQNGKPFALTEFGAGSGPVDFSQWMQAIHQQMPAVSYFMAWNGPWGPEPGTNNTNGNDLLTDPGVLNQGQVQ